MIIDYGQGVKGWYESVLQSLTSSKPQIGATFENSEVHPNTKGVCSVETVKQRCLPRYELERFDVLQM